MSRYVGPRISEGWRPQFPVQPGTPIVEHAGDTCPKCGSPLGRVYRSKRSGRRLRVCQNPDGCPQTVVVP